MYICVAPLASAATLTYSYDGLNRLTNASYSDGSTEAYSYDNAGNRLSRSTTAATVQVDTTAPSIPGSLGTNFFSPSQLSIFWKNSTDTGGSGLAGYEIFLNGPGIGTTTTTNFTLTGLLPNSSYCLSIAAFDRGGNISAPSTNLCLTTPVFQPPTLSPIMATAEQFQVSIAGGTPGPYDVLVSSNLVDWQPWTNLFLSTTGSLNETIGPSRQRFYELRWSTNTP